MITVTRIEHEPTPAPEPTYTIQGLTATEVAWLAALVGTVKDKHKDVLINGDSFQMYGALMDSLSPSARVEYGRMAALLTREAWRL